MKVFPLLKNFILILALTFVLSLCFTPKSFALAEDSVLDTVDYLDFTLNSPKAIYGDDDVIVVSCAEEMVFFYQSKIFCKDISAAGQLMRNGDYIYYTKNSLLFRVEIGSFTESAVTDNEGTPIAANSFAINGSRLIALTNSGAIFYEDFKRISPPYDFTAYDNITNQQIAAGNVHIADTDYFNINGETFKQNQSLRFDVVDYFAHVGSDVYFSNKKGVFRLDGETTTCVYERDVKIRNEGVLGICGFNGNLLFIDGLTSEVMLLNLSSGVAEKYLFDVVIQTGLSLTFTETPTTVTVAKDVRAHAGDFENGAFTYKKTNVTQTDFDLVKIGTVDKYAVVYGLDGFLLIDEAHVTQKAQNNPITFEKGFVLHDCTAYLTCVATRLTESFTLTKGEEVNVISKLNMNGVDYLLVQKGEEQGFVLAGEIKEGLSPNYPTPNTNTTVVTGKDNTTVAYIIMLLSAGVFILTLFVILARKEYFKL